MSEATTPHRPIGRLVVTALSMILISSLTSQLTAGIAIILAAANLNASEYQSPPASQEAEELRKGIQQLIELEKKMREEEARKAGPGGATGQAPTTQPAHKPAPQPGAAAAPNDDKRSAPLPSAASQPGEAAPPTTAPRTVSSEPAAQSTSTGADQPTGVSQTGPASTPDLAVAGEELVGPPANFRTIRPQRRPTPTSTDPQPTGQPTEPGGAAAPVAVKAPEARPVVSADGRNEFFNFDKTPWEDVVKYFAEKLDKPVMGIDELVMGGELTYINPKRFTLEEAIDELNLLMQYQGYRFVETENYIEVIPLSEMPMRVPVKRIYPTREAYVADLPKLRRMDWVIVHYKVLDKPARMLVDTFGDALPDHARISVLGDTNTIKLVGTVLDLNRFFDLAELVSLEPTDPRQIKVFEIQTNAAEVERMVRALMDLPQTSPFGQPFQRIQRPRPGVAQQQVGVPQPEEELEAIITADERTNSLIVTATPAQMQQIEKLIKQIDIKPNLGEFKTAVVPILYADATEVERVLTQIFQQERGQTGPAWQQQRQLQLQRQQQQQRRNLQQPVQPQAQQPTPESIIAEGIFEQAKKTVRIAADERTNSLIVYANDDGQKRVKELLKIIDVAVPSNFRSFRIVNTDAAKIYPVVEQIAQGLGGLSTRATRGRGGVRVVLDEANESLLVLADREEMVKIEEVIQRLDVAGPELTRHVVHLEKLLPSKVAPTLQQLMSEQPGAAGGSSRGRRGPAMVTGVGTAQIIPLDEAQLLIVICGDRDWEKVQETLSQWDDEAISDQPEFVTYEVKNAQAGQLASMIDAFYRNYQHPVLGRSQVVVQAQGSALLVQAIEPAQDEIAELIQRLDVGDLTKIEVLRLQHADAADVAEQAQRLFSTAGGTGVRGRGAPAAGAGDTLIDAEPATNSLIVRADSATIERIKDFALAQDLRVGQFVPEPRFYTLKFAKPREVAEAVNALFGGGGRSARGARGGGGGATRGTSVTAMDTQTQVVVEAPAEKHEQIAKFIANLDSPEGREAVTTLVKMPGAPVSQIAGTLRQNFRQRVQDQGMVAEFNADTTTETILITCTQTLMPEVERLIGEFKTMTSELVMQRDFRKLRFAPAEETAKWLEPQLQATVTTLLGSAAAKQVQVIPEPRTGRVMIYAPQVAVKEAMQLLEQYDIEVADPTPPNFMHTEARKLAGLDVRNLAQNLMNIYNTRPQRPDRLKATFQADELTESIILSVPKDWKQEVDDLIGQFANETEKVAAEQRFYDLKNADAAYVVQKLTDVLVSKVRQRRPALADRIQITVDDRLNRVVINAPKVVHEDAAALVAELDQPPLARNQLRTIALTNLEAEQAFQVLQKVFQDKISKQKTLQVTSDPTTNSIVIRGTDDDYNEISRWLTRQDGDAAGKKRDLRVLTLDNATSPDQIVAVLTERYSPKGVGRREKVGNEVSFQTLGSTGVVVSAPQDQMSEIETLVKVLDQATSEADLVTEFIDVHFADPNELANVVRQFFGEWKRTQGAKAQNVYVTVANNTLLVRAPATEMAKIKQVIEQADADVPMALDVRSFDLKVMSAESVAQQVNFFLATLGTVSKKGEIRPFAYGEGNTNTLVVGAPRKYMPFITGLISGIEAKQIPQGEPKSFPLQFVRAEQVQANIQTLLDAKVNENEAGRKSKTPVKVVAEPSTNRLFIYAPEQYQRLAEQVVQMVDSELETGEVVRIVQLERGDAKQLAQTLTGMQTSGRVGAGAGQAKVNITADEGSNSVILRGLPKDVAELQKHASALEDKSDVVPDLRVFNIRYASTGQMLDILQPMFEGAGKGATAMRPVTFTEDEDRSRLIVTANRRQMAQIADVIAELDVNPYNPDGSPRDESGKQIYFVDISRGDAFDIAWDVRDLFPDEDKGGPSIDSDWDGKYIKVKCRPGEFASVLKAIRDVESRAVVEKKIVVRNAPPQKQQERTFDYLKSRLENVQINVAPVSADEETMVEVLRPDAKKKKQEAAGARSKDQKPTDERSARPPAGADARFRKGGGMGRLGCLVLTLLLQEAAAQSQPAGDRTDVSTSQPSYGASAGAKREGAQILVQPDGKLVIFGPEDAVDDVEEVLDMIEEDLAEGQVLRIFEFTYGDVNAAAEVLNIMFNDRQAAQLQQALQQQQLQQQQQQQQQRQRQSQGRGDDGDNKEQQGGGVVDQIRGMVGGQQPGNDRRASAGARQAQQGGQRIKIATDASHNYLIVKCDEADLPEIRKLLRELDIPPGESDIRVFQLVRVDAIEAAENIRSVLKIDKAKSRSGAAGVAPGTAGRGAQQDMLQMLQQQMMSVPGVEGGAKIESVEVVPNKITNSLLVSAPPEAMKVIENLIQTLEDLEAREVLGIYYFDLAHAKVDDVLPLLREVFQASAGGSRSASPAALGPVTLSADPRSNRIIYTAQAKDVAIVEAQIRTLDIEGPFAEAETHVLQYGNAGTIADTVERIFAAAASAGGRREGAGASSTEALRIAAEPATNSITVWGPADKRTQIFKKVREFEEMSRRSFRDLTLIYADAEDLAEKLRTVFAGGGGAARGGRGADAAQAANSVVIVGDKNAKKLLVKAPDAVYEQIEALVKQLDAPNETLKFRTFAVKHADAQVLVDRVKGAFIEYMAQLPRTPGGKPPFDPFTAVADPRTNSVTVVGSDTTLAFVGRLLGEVDVPTPTEQHKQFRIFPLDKADAVTVADAINTFAQGGAAGPSGANRSGLRPGLTPGGANAPILAVNAIPESTMNAVMVYGKPEDIDIVDREVLQKLEQLGLREEFATITVQQASPSQIVTFVQQFLDEFPAAQSPGGRGPQTGGAARRGPRMIPNDVSKQIVVRGSPGQIKEVQDLVARFDNKDLAAQQVKVRRVPSGQDAQRLAQEVEQLVNGAEEQAARASGRPARPVVVGSDPYTNTIILAGAPENFGLVDALLDQLEKMRNPNQVTRVIQFTNLTSDDAQSVIDQLQSRRQGANTGRGRTRSPNQQPGFFPGGGNGGGGGTIRRPVGPTGPRRGAWRIERAAPDPIASGGNGAWLRACPTIVASSFTPLLVGFALDEATRLAMAASQPAAEAAQVAQAPQEPQPERPRAFGADRAQAEQARPAQPPAGLPDLTGVTGTLQGDVIVQPIGTKQIIVTGDEQDIAFIEQILALMEQSAPRPQIEIFTLQNAKAAPIAQVVTKAMEQFIQSSGTPAPEDRFSISAETGSNSLIVSAADRNMTYIADLISKLDVERVEGQTEFKTIILANALASDVVTQLKPAIERLGKIRSVPAEAQPSVQAFNNINGVLVIGTPKDISEIARLVEALDIKLDDEIAAGASFTRADVILIPLRNAVAEDVATTLTDMIKEQQDLAREAAKGEGGKPFVRKLKLRTSSGLELPELDLERPIRIIAEKGTNSLIVFSAAKNLEPLQAIVAVFDTLPAAEDVSVRAFVLKYGRSEAVAELLDKVFKEGKGALRRTGEGAGETIEKGVLPPAPPGAAGKGLPYNVAVSHDARSNTVLVIGQKDAVLLAGGLIAELDKPSAQLGVEPHIVELKNIAAAKLAERLQDVLDKRMKTLGDGNDARDSAVLIPEDRSNLLVVFATQEMFELVSRLANELDQAPSYTTIDTRMHELKFADAAKLQKTLQDLFDKKKEAEPGDEPKNTIALLADLRTNSLLLTGTRDYLAEAETLIDRLDRQGLSATVDVEVFPIQFNNPANIATLIQELIDKSRTDDNKGTPVYLKADAVSRNVLVAAAREDMSQIRRWVDLLDKPAEIGLKTAIVPLQRGSAEDVADRVDELFKPAGGQGGAGETGLSITYDAVTNSIVAVGPPSLVAEVEGLVRKLDTTDPSGGALVRIFRLDQADAESAGELLQSILQGRGGAVGGRTGGGTTGGGTSGAAAEAARKVMLIYEQKNGRDEIQTLRALRDEVVVTADTRTNSLVITAPPASMALLESLVAAIDVPPRSDKIEVFALRNSDAEQMSTTLQEIFNQQSASTRTTGRTTAGGQQSDEERRLTFAGTGGTGREQITFTADIRTNSVIAAGTPGYLKLAEELVYRLDTQPIEDRKTIVYAPRNIVAADLASSIRDYSEAEQSRLQALGEDISAQRKQEREIVAIDNENANRVILSFSPRFESDVLDIVRELDQPPPQVSIETLIIQLQLNNSLDLGMEFAFQDLQFAKAGPTDTTTFDFVGGTDVGAAGSGGLGGFTFTITGADFNFLFRTLQSEGRLSVLSRPHIVAMDNQEAVIKVVNDVPYVSGTSTSIAGQITTQVNREEVGITLEVTPHINPDGFVRLEIRQEVSDIGTSSIPIQPGVNAPIFLVREAETVVTVRDGETVVLGGLIRSRDEDVEQKIPIVGDIPLLGALFRTTSQQREQEELLVVLTPRVLRSVEDYREESIFQRDRSGTLPGEILTSPLMNRLRVPPEELAPSQQDGALGPFRQKPERYKPYTDEGRSRLPEELRPQPSDDAAPSRSATPPPPAKPSFDVPVPSRRSGPAQLSAQQTSYDLPIPASYRARVGT